MQDIIQPMVGCRRFCIIGKSRTMAAKKTTILESRVRNRLADIHQTQAWLAEKMELSDAAISKWLTNDRGHPKLREHLASIVTLLKISTTPEQFKQLVDQVHPRFGDTYSFDFKE